MQAISNGGQEFGGRIQLVDDGGGSFVRGDTTRAVTMFGVSGRPISRFVFRIPPDPEWDWKGVTVLEHPATTRPQDLQGLFSKSGRVIRVTS